VRQQLSSGSSMLVLRMHLKHIGLTTAGCILVLATFVILDSGSNRHRIVHNQFDLSPDESATKGDGGNSQVCNIIRIQLPWAVNKKMSHSFQNRKKKQQML
jgi:hypothetical protein